MKIIIDYPESVIGYNRALDSVREYLFHNGFEETPVISGFKIGVKVETKYGRNHVSCTKNKNSYKFNVWLAV